MKEVKYCPKCYETDISDNEDLCIYCRMEDEAELQEYYARFDRIEKDEGDKHKYE